MSTLKRELGLFGAVVTGLGSILGTGVFVSIALAADISGTWILLAAPLAGVVATFNGLSSAQLAAAHPVAGGTYEYGYRFLNPWVGFTAGWLFLIAKTASASTAALGFAGYALVLLGASSDLQVAVAVGAAVAVTALVIAGIKRTATVNAVLVAITVGSLATFIVAGLTDGPTLGAATVEPAGPWWRSLLAGTAFMFVAYTGYGRIATLGEEVHDPTRTIPRAVITTLAVSAVLYTAVAFTGWTIARNAWHGVGRFFDDETKGAPLAGLISGIPAQIVEIGAIVAMLGVLLNLVLGLSRVWLAMGRRHDMPSSLATVSRNGSPTAAVILTGAFVVVGALVGDVQLTWGFSAMTVLLYYAITNWAALRLPPEARRFPRWMSWAGLASCAFLSFWVEPAVWTAGALVIAAGIGWRVAWSRRRSSGTP
jgi:APA family basic amino acid/polyamine antiporter